MNDIIFNEEEFHERLVKALLAGKPASCRLEFEICEHNNSIEKRIVRFRMEGRLLSPAIDLTDLYEVYLLGSSPEEIAEAVIRTAMTGMPGEDPDPSFFRDYEKAGARMGMKLINLERNRKSLEEVPYIPFEDLALTFYVLVPGLPAGAGMVRVRNLERERWGVTPEDLYRRALENGPRILPPVCRKLSDYLDVDLPDSDCSMEMLTNIRHWYGASAIFYPGLMKELSDRMGDDIFIMPSSIHEVMLVPAEGEDPDNLASIVRAANRLDIPEEDFLSDSLYRYSRAKDRICRVLPPNL